MLLKLQIRRKHGAQDTPPRALQCRLCILALVTIPHPRVHADPQNRLLHDYKPKEGYNYAGVVCMVYDECFLAMILMRVLIEIAIGAYVSDKYVANLVSSDLALPQM